MTDQLNFCCVCPQYSDINGGSSRADRRGSHERWHGPQLPEARGANKTTSIHGRHSRIPTERETPPEVSTGDHPPAQQGWSCDIISEEFTLGQCFLRKISKHYPKCE